MTENALLAGLLKLLEALIPGMLGAIVGQLWKPGLSWRERLIQWIVGVSCQYYVSLGIIHGLGWHPFVAQGLGFFAAMAAFDVAPRLVKALADIAAALPETFRKFAGHLIAKWTGGPPPT